MGDAPWSALPSGRPPPCQAAAQPLLPAGHPCQLTPPICPTCSAPRVSLAPLTPLPPLLPACPPCSTCCHQKLFDCVGSTPWQAPVAPVLCILHKIAKCNQNLLPFKLGLKTEF